MANLVKVGQTSLPDNGWLFFLFLLTSTPHTQHRFTGELMMAASHLRSSAPCTHVCTNYYMAIGTKVYCSVHAAEHNYKRNYCIPGEQLIVHEFTRSSFSQRLNGLVRETMTHRHQPIEWPSSPKTRLMDSQPRRQCDWQRIRRVKVTVVPQWRSRYL